MPLPWLGPAATGPARAKREPERAQPHFGESRSRSAIEERPATNSARPSADRRSGQKGRQSQHARHGENQETPKPSADRTSGEKGRQSQHARHGENQKPPAERRSRFRRLSRVALG